MKYVIIDDEKSAVEYIQMILDRWDSWQTHHTALVQALKILVSAHKLLTEANKTISKLLVEKTVTVIEFDKQIERLTEENERLRANAKSATEILNFKFAYDAGKADTVRKIQDKFARNIGTYTNKDSILVYAMFNLLSEITKEILEEK